MSMNPSNNDAVMAELLRVYGAYSFAAPNRWGKITLKASLINPYAKSDEELDEWELLQLLKNNEPSVRTRAANLLAQKNNLNSYLVAKAIIDAIKNENNLEVIRWFNNAFAHVTGYSPNQIDGSDTVEWWQKHELEFAKKNTDQHNISK